MIKFFINCIDNININNLLFSQKNINILEYVIYQKIKKLFRVLKRNLFKKKIKRANFYNKQITLEYHIWNIKNYFQKI